MLKRHGVEGLMTWLVCDCLPATISSTMSRAMRIKKVTFKLTLTDRDKEGDHSNDSDDHE